MVDENNTPENNNSAVENNNTQSNDTQNPNATSEPAKPAPSETTPATEKPAEAPATETKADDGGNAGSPAPQMFKVKLEGLIAGEKEFPAGTKLMDAAKAMGAGTPTKVSYSDKTSGRDVSFNHLVNADIHLSTTQKSSGG